MPDFSPSTDNQMAPQSKAETNSTDVKNDETTTKTNVDTESAKLPDPTSHQRPKFEKDNIDAHYDKLHWVLAAIGRLLSLQFAPINIPLERRLQTGAALFWMSTFLFMGLACLFLLLYIFFYTEYWYLTVIYLTYYIMDRETPRNGGRRFSWFRYWSMWKHFANFFPAKIIKTVDYSPDKNYIFGYHPHGVLTAGGSIHFGTEGSGFSKMFPGLTPHFVILEGHFSLPLYRDFIMSFGAIGHSKQSINNTLKQGPGKAVCIVVGGAPESLDCHPGTAVLHLQKRKGFCKLALQNGASLVPVFSFGENDIYDQVANPPGSTIRNIQDYLQKKIGLAPVAFLGRGVFQYSFGIVPFRKPINTVFGEPIDVPKIENPTSEDIVNLHTKYCEALTELYNDYKPIFAENTDAQLQII